MTVELETAASARGPALILRRWRPSDAPDLVATHRDKAMRHWTTAVLENAADATHWIHDQNRAWEAGERFTFAVTEPQGPGTGPRLVGNAVLKNVTPGSPSAEVGYWTAAHARGRAVAPRALETLTTWAFTIFAAQGLTRLELLHQVDNTASCRVAHKCAYHLTTQLPAHPPAFPQPGHVHTREHPQHTQRTWPARRT